MELRQERLLYQEMLAKGQLKDWFKNHFCYEMIFEEHIILLNKKKQEERHGNHPHTYYPNRLGYCMRNQQLSSLFPSESALHSLKTFFRGDTIQDHEADIIIAQWGERHGLGFTKVERSFTIPIMREGKPTIYVKGRMDELLVLKDDAGDIPIEIKTAKSLKGKKASSFNNQCQLTPYQVVNHETFGYLVYIDKQCSPETDDDAISCTFREVFDNECWLLLVAILCTIDDATMQNKLVVAEAQLPHSEHAWECRPLYCPYYKWCHSQPVAETTIDFTLLNKNEIIG